jgi:tRNA(Ile)-lysidine synthase
MLRKVKKTIEDYAMLSRGDRVVAAVSGGPDSVALLKILTVIADEYNLSLLVAHLNHGLRGEEGEKDADFVGRLARDMGVESVSKRIDITTFRGRGQSLEELCRDERYAFLKQAAHEYGATKIALGHHLQDQAETVLMNLFRGSGSDGLRGMLPVREGMIIRPLIQVTREEIGIFLEQQGLSFMNDSSNSQDFYLRNRIRHHLMPLLKDGFNPQMEKNLARTAEIMRLDDDYMERVVAELLQGWGIFRDAGERKICIPELMKLHEALRHRVIRALLIRTAKTGKDIGYRHVKAAAALAQGGQVSGSLDLPGGVTLRREYDLLTFYGKMDRHGLSAHGRSGAETSGRHLFYYGVNIPGQVDVKEAGMTITFQLMAKPDLPLLSGRERIAYMDYETMHPPLAIRNAKPGDRMQLLGMKGTKKLKSLFIDEKVPRRQRHLVPILVDQKSILWIAAMRMSEKMRVTDKTRQVLKVEIV